MGFVFNRLEVGSSGLHESEGRCFAPINLIAHTDITLDSGLYK